jgi:DNA-binding transcriptional LysR family regulator
MRCRRSPLRVRDVVASVVNQRVRSEDVDPGLTGGTLSAPSIEVLHASEDRLCVIRAPGHALMKKRHVRVDDVAACPLILISDYSKSSLVLEKGSAT